MISPFELLFIAIVVLICTKLQTSLLLGTVRLQNWISRIAKLDFSVPELSLGKAQIVSLIHVATYIAAFGAVSRVIGHWVRFSDGIWIVLIPVACAELAMFCVLALQLRTAFWRVLLLVFIKNLLGCLICFTPAIAVVMSLWFFGK